MEAQIQHLQEEFDLGMTRLSTTEMVRAVDVEGLSAKSAAALVPPMTNAAPAADLHDEFTDAL